MILGLDRVHTSFEFNCFCYSGSRPGLFLVYSAIELTMRALVAFTILGLDQVHTSLIVSLLLFGSRPGLFRVYSAIELTMCALVVLMILCLDQINTSLI